MQEVQMVFPLLITVMSVLLIRSPFRCDCCVRQSFAVPQAVREYYQQQAARAAAAETQWEATFAEYAQRYPDLAAQFKRRMAGELPADEAWVDKLPGNPAVRLAL